MVTSEHITRTYIEQLTNNLPHLDKKASEAIKSFADLVEELNKVNKLSNGTPVKEQITKLAGELNNSSVFFTKMISEELSKIHSLVYDKNESEPKV